MSKLRTPDALKTVLDDPRQLEEILKMLEDQKIGVRQTAAATLARLAESHPEHLPRVLPGIRESLDDDSPYVRWHLVYVLGKIGFHFTDKAAVFIDDLISLLDDSNRIVRIIAVNAFRQIESGQPGIIEHFFKNIEKEIPPSLVGVLRNSKNCRRRINKSRPLMPGKQ